MASPQKENGFTPVANEILEQIAKVKLNGTQFRIIMIIWRCTYGFNKKQYSISETYISKAIGVAKPHISREIAPLFNKKILVVIKPATFSESAIIGFNKNYDEWQLLSSNTTVTELGNTTVTELGNTTVTELGNTTVTELGNQKRKEKEKENTSKKSDFAHDSFFESIWKLYPEKKGKAQVSRKSKKVLFEHGYDTVKRSIERYVADKPEWKQYQHGSTFFNSGYIDYLDDNYSKDNAAQDIPNQNAEERPNF